MQNNSCETEAVTLQKLNELWLHVLYMCNLHCKHCLFTCSAETGNRQMSLADCEDYVTGAVSKGVKAIYVTGGEPLLWPYLQDFLNWFYSQGQVVPLTILTNGTLLDSSQAEFFGRFTSRGLTLRVSMECYTRENHEQFRGAGSFDKTLEGIRNLNKFGIEPWIAYVNKSGGTLNCMETQSLESDFLRRLLENYGLKVAGLKIIGAFSKGRFAGQVNYQAMSKQILQKTGALQCSYGIAVSTDGVFPCPVLVDVPGAELGCSLKDAVGNSFLPNYDFCEACFATGTTCGR